MQVDDDDDERLYLMRVTYDSIFSYTDNPMALKPNPPCQLSLWEETGVPGENPRLSTSFTHMINESCFKGLR